MFHSLLILIYIKRGQFFVAQFFLWHPVYKFKRNATLLWALPKMGKILRLIWQHYVNKITLQVAALFANTNQEYLGLQPISDELLCTKDGGCMMFGKATRLAEWWNPAFERIKSTTYRDICAKVDKDHGKKRVCFRVWEGRFENKKFLGSFLCLTPNQEQLSRHVTQRAQSKFRPRFDFSTFLNSEWKKNPLKSTSNIEISTLF